MSKQQNSSSMYLTQLHLHTHLTRESNLCLEKPVLVWSFYLFWRTKYHCSPICWHHMNKQQENKHHTEGTRIQACWVVCGASTATRMAMWYPTLLDIDSWDLIKSLSSHSHLHQLYYCPVTSFSMAQTHIN